MKISLLILIAIASISCARPVSVPVDLGPCPLPPELVVMTDVQYFRFLDFAEQNKDIIKILNKREDQLQEHVHTLCSIIESTHGDP